MTDKQLKTILECCASDENIECCKKCALCEKYDCYSEISKNVLDLINRQKAEIERLKDYNENLITANMELSDEILEIKSEAIKEFAERLKSEYEDKTQGRYMNWLMNDIIDNLVKEMTEDL